MEHKESIGRIISTIHRHICIYLDVEFEKYGLGSGQVPLLRTLQNEDGINQEKLAAMFKVNKTTIARAIDKLIKEGYVSRKKDPADNRAYKIHLTDKGKKIGPEIKKALHQLTETLSFGFTEDEKKSVMILLEKMAVNILAVNKKNGKLTDE